MPIVEVQCQPILVCPSDLIGHHATRPRPALTDLLSEGYVGKQSEESPYKIQDGNLLQSGESLSADKYLHECGAAERISLGISDQFPIATFTFPAGASRAAWAWAMVTRQQEDYDQHHVKDKSAEFHFLLYINITLSLLTLYFCLTNI